MSIVDKFLLFLGEVMVAVGLASLALVLLVAVIREWFRTILGG